ncbi:MAG: sigma 54-interacting transcriptional regulator [Planctomycetaceae bacterium]
MEAHKPFIEVNCGAIPAELVESEFFGHEKGAFTGAISARGGYLESAEGGTLFDELANFRFPAQVKLLRRICRKKVTRVGGSKTKKVDFRVIAATNRSLIHEVAEKRFREDLFHRLAVGVIQLPLHRPSRRPAPVDIIYLSKPY